MKTIQLTGRLGKEFGSEFLLNVDSPAEGIRALCYQIPGFEVSLKQGEYRVTRLSSDDSERDIDETEVTLAFGKARGVRIEPVVGGGKKKGLGKLVMGIALVGAAFAFAPAAAGAAGTFGKNMAANAFLGVTHGQLATQGAMMALMGASSLLSPSVQAPDPADQDESFFLNATGNLIEQGNPVPLVYGEVFTGSVMVSSGLTAEEIPTSDEEEDE